MKAFMILLRKAFEERRVGRVREFISLVFSRLQLTCHFYSSSIKGIFKRLKKD
jgi:hypothetical protein